MRGCVQVATLNSQKVAVRAVAKWYKDGRPDGKPLVKEVGSGAFVCPTYPTTQRVVDHAFRSSACIGQRIVDLVQS